jgi:hypothetical protein
MLKVSGSNPDGNRVLTFCRCRRRRAHHPSGATTSATIAAEALRHDSSQESSRGAVAVTTPLACDAILRRRVHAQLSQLYASAPPTMPPALTRAASTGVDAYALFRAIDIDDSSAVPVEELLLCGAALGAQ